MRSCFMAWRQTRSGSPGLRFTHTLCDIEFAESAAMEGVYDVSAISFHAYLMFRITTHCCQVRKRGRRMGR